MYEEWSLEAEIKGEKKGKIKGKAETIRNLLKANIPLETALKRTEPDKAAYNKPMTNIPRICGKDFTISVY